MEKIKDATDCAAVGVIKNKKHIMCHGAVPATFACRMCAISCLEDSLPSAVKKAVQQETSLALCVFL